MLTLLALLASQAMAIPCAAHVEGDLLALADPLAFAPRTADLTPESAGPVQGIACLLEEQPNLRLQIEVHTDARGSESYNLRVSQERAEALRSALVDKGVAADRLTAVGRGESMPVEHGDWATSQAMSRRIELWTDPAARPPAPEIAPPPEPEPLPVVVTDTETSMSIGVLGSMRFGLCDVLAGLPQLYTDPAGATNCGFEGSAWICRFGESTATLAGRVQACVGGERDGDELYVTLPHGRLSVVPNRGTSPGVSVMRYEPQD
jgi:hypothetical protein